MPQYEAYPCPYGQHALPAYLKHLIAYLMLIAGLYLVTKLTMYFSRLYFNPSQNEGGGPYPYIIYVTLERFDAKTPFKRDGPN